MMKYHYPANLAAKPTVWWWSVRDFLILSFLVLVSVVAIVLWERMLPAAFALTYAFLTIRKDELTILEYVKFAFSYFILNQQTFKWR